MGAGRLPIALARNVEAIRLALGLKAGDSAFFVAGDPDKFAKFAGLARTKVGRNSAVDEDRFEFAWVVDFPMYEWDEEEKKVEFSHNPFSMPQGGLEALLSLRSSRSKRSSTTLHATATNSPQAGFATTGRGDVESLRDRGLRRTR